MNTAFPAATGTFLAVLDATDDTVTMIPVVGWQTAQGARVVPLVAQTPIALGRGVAIIMPHHDADPNDTDGDHVLVTDPTFSRTFDYLSSWVEFVSQQPEDEAAPEDLIAGLGAHILFDSTKTYRKGSFWQFKGHDGDEFVFEVPADFPIPDDDRVTKINRDIFGTQRKVQPVVRASTLYDDQKPDEDEDAFDAEAEDLV